MSREDVTRVLTGCQALLLDFDGPICSVFAGYSAPQVAAELVNLLQDRGVELPAAVVSETDPLEVLRWAGALGDQALTTAVEDALCAAELHAVGSAAPTPFGREIIVGAREAGLPVAVVSNNSTAVVAVYLTTHRLASYIKSIIGRAYAEPERMKPNPEPILSAANSLEVEPRSCVLVGDSLSDIEGAKAAGVPVIGYANKAPKTASFRQAQADAVVTSMAEIAKLFVSH